MMYLEWSGTISLSRPFLCRGISEIRGCRSKWTVVALLINLQHGSGEIIRWLATLFPPLPIHPHPQLQNSSVALTQWTNDWVDACRRKLQQIRDFLYFFQFQKGKLPCQWNKQGMRKLSQGSFSHLSHLWKHVFILIAFDIEMDPTEMAAAGSGLVRGNGFNSFWTTESKGRRMNPAVREAHQIFTPQGQFQLLSETAQQEQMETHFASKGRLMTS